MKKILVIADTGRDEFVQECASKEEAIRVAENNWTSLAPADKKRQQIIAGVAIESEDGRDIEEIYWDSEKYEEEQKRLKTLEILQNEYFDDTDMEIFDGLNKEQLEEIIAILENGEYKSDEEAISLIMDAVPYLGVKRKISFNAGGAGGISAKVSLPIAMLRDMGIDKDSPAVKIKKEGDEIIIEKLETNK